MYKDAEGKRGITPRKIFTHSLRQSMSVVKKTETNAGMFGVK